ncbi:CFS_G0023970.mRNA.1.CDS.1 [Saccharomyces cerevisiae]|nr:CFS_G0023970.mRNA.1.CDS.1 [Saccharomyces cerevisiae]CAI7331325.1 CFS_G0023970.mRNA.1.CDS.1 [Saccharomyces cerevisiae]
MVAEFQIASAQSSTEEEHCSINSDKAAKLDLELTSERKNDGKQSHEVTFNEDIADPEDIARHMSTARRYYISSLITFTSMVITMISSTGRFLQHIIEHFHISHEVSTLGNYALCVWARYRTFISVSTK